MMKEAKTFARQVYINARAVISLHSNGLRPEDNLVNSGRRCSMRLIRLKHRLFLVCFSLLCLPFAPAKSVISAPTAKDYKQFLGGVSFPYCDDVFDIPKFVDLQREGSLTGSIRRAIFDGEEAKALVFGIGAGGNCSYFRTSSGVILHGQPSQTASIQKISDGKYLYAHFQGEPDYLEVKGGNYRGWVPIPGKLLVLDGFELSPWKPISKSGLRFVRNGVIYNPMTPKTPYWCSQGAPGWQPFSREYPILFCTSNGLTSAKPANFKGMF